MTFPGYKIERQVHRGTRSQVFQAMCLASGDRVVLKENAIEGATSAGRARLEREFSVAAPIRSEHVVGYLGLEHFDHRVAVVEEAFGDRSLAELLLGSGIDVEIALWIAVQVASGLSEIHEHGVIHGAIHPGNIVVDTSTWCAKIVDFSHASALQVTPEPTQRLDESAMPLAYISPEQTGRMNRKVDYRTDFYSLGATLYFALSGSPPFDLVDQLSLIHAQLAVAPRPLCDLGQRIPVQVSRVVDKLLAKNAEDRYLSARGLVADLNECLKQLRKTGTVSEFSLGRCDVPEKFLISPKLYGRSEERTQLLDAFDKAAAGGKLLLLLRGYSGIGKSSLVNEVHKPIVARHGSFAAGKFEPLKAHTPYSALAQALTQLCRGLLSLPEAELAAHKRAILARLSANAGLMVDLVPELEQVIGPQPPVPEAGMLAAQHRFDLTLVRFLSTFASAAHPLVLFLDDLQWADPATLHALGALVRLPEPTHLLVLGAYRENEVDAAHPLAIALEELSRTSVDVRTVSLPGLDSDAVAALVADTLHQTPAEVHDLARLVVAKTSGNPFFVEEFLYALHDEELLTFSSERGVWTWDLRAIEAHGITANVVDLMVRKLDQLPSATQEAVQLAACVGDRFDLALLSSAAGMSPGAMRARLSPAIHERLVVPLDPSYPIGLIDVSRDREPDQTNYHYRFLHDRVQHAAYESIPEARRPEYHLRFGRLMLRQTDRAASGERLFQIVDQLNHGSSLVGEQAERTEVARLNCEAGKRARKATAYNEGLGYLQRGIALLPEAAWEEHYALWFTLHLTYVECAYLSGRFDEASSVSDAFLPRIHTEPEQAELYLLRIALETHRGQYARAIELGREALSALGHPVPRLSSALPLMRSRVKLLLAMRRRRVEDLAKLPELRDPHLIAVVRLLGSIRLPGFYSGDKRLLFWSTHETLNLVLRHGMTSSAVTAFSSYGLFLAAQQRDYERAFAFGKLALEFVQREDAFPYRANVQHVVACFIHAYADNPLRSTIPLVRRVVELGLESGDLLFTSNAAGLLPRFRLMVGDPLHEVDQEVERCDRSIRAFRYGDMLLAIEMVRQSVRCLRGETRGPRDLMTSASNASGPGDELPTTPTMTAHYVALKIILLTLFGDCKEAVRMIVASDDKIIASHGGLIMVTDYAFYACLALLEGLREPEFERHTLLPLLEQKRKWLADWAESAPSNFRHKHLLVSAELAEVDGRPGDATKLYNDAIEVAHAGRFQQQAALASELAGRAFARRGQPHIAGTYLEAARAGYASWGAHGKVRALERAYPELLHRLSPPEQAPVTLDMIGVVRASQALSSEISLPVVIERVMRVIVQTSGAQRGWLLRLDDKGQLEIEAHLDAARSVVEVPVDAGANVVPEAIVRYTLRTGEDVVLAHAAEEGPFTADPYVLAHASKSILCVAVRHRDRTTGVLFLENELSPHVFTRERLDVLKLLVAQAAISLENARLYDTLRAREALQRDFFESMPVGVYVMDAQGRPVFTNRRAAEIVGQPNRNTGWGLAPSDRVQYYLAGSDELYPAERDPLTRALKGETSMVDDLEIRRPDYVARLAVWGTPIRDDAGSVRFAIVAFQDISAQRAMEAQLHQAERLESIGRLAGGIAHDFNNLLTPILVYSELASQALPADSPIGKQITQVHAAAERAAELVRQLLAFGRKQTLEVCGLDLNRELRSFERLFRGLVREDIEVRLQLASGLEEVRADPSQLQRILMNLGLNAADAMPRGGLITFETESVAGPWIALRVIDTGPGIDQQALARIFEPFFTTKGPDKGTGLGLPTVHGLLKQQGGQISVKSELGKGTTFEILLPRLPEIADAAPEVRSELSAAPLGHGETILLVEDDDAVRTVVKDILARDGYRVIAAGKPTEALGIAHRLGDGLDLLVSDMVMPVMNGRELFRELSREHADLPALFISGYSDDVDAAQGRPDVEILAKPLSTHVLRTKVRDLLATPSAAPRSVGK